MKTLLWMIYISTIGILAMLIKAFIEWDFIQVFIWALVLMFIYVLHMILFSLHTNKYPKNSISNFKLISSNNLNNKFEYVFSNKNGVWYCENYENCYFDLKGYIFPKKYIIAFLIRNYRYKVISKRKPLKYLFKLCFKVSNAQNLFINVIFKKENEKIINKKIQIIKNGTYTSNIIYNAINRTRYIRFYFSNFSYRFISKEKNAINEYVYMKGQVRDLPSEKSSK